MASELGRRAAAHLESAIQGARSRFNGHSGSDEERVDLPEETGADSVQFRLNRTGLSGSDSVDSSTRSIANLFRATSVRNRGGCVLAYGQNEETGRRLGGRHSPRPVTAILNKDPGLVKKCFG